MKVLIVRNAFPQDFGGAERLAVHLALELHDHGVNSRVITRHRLLSAYAEDNNLDHHTGWWWQRQNWNGLRVFLTPLYFGWIAALTGWYLWTISRFNPTALHLMSKDDFIAGTIAGKILGQRIVWTDCADLKHVYRNNQIWYKNPIGKAVYFISQFADLVTLVSNSEKTLIENSLGHEIPKNYRVVHLASRHQEVTAYERTTEAKHDIIFCATSRLVTDKGIAELIEAFNLLPEKNNYRLWLVGDGPERNKFERQAKANQKIEFIGHTSSPLSYVKSCDVFVHPTYHEGFSLSLAEAAMLGKPLIATNVGGNPELVNSNNGILVPTKNAKVLSEAMYQLAVDGDLRKILGENARKDYEEKINFSVLVSKQIIPHYGKE